MFSITNFIIACLIYHTAYGVDTQIVGGKDASDGQYPYQVSLKIRPNENHFCGGAIISERYIITAAHCLEGLHSNDVSIDVGSIHLHSPETRYTAHSLIIHPQYNKTLHINDIGLINVTEEISFNKNTRSIDLISYDHNFEGVAFTVTGWGRLWEGGSIPERLQEIVVRGFSQKSCANEYRNFNDFQICTLNAVGQGMCNGDSGSALTYNNSLVGIVSYGTPPCASGHADVFTRVYFYREWINTYINTGNNTNDNQQPNQAVTNNIILGLFVTCLCFVTCCSFL